MVVIWLDPFAIRFMDCIDEGIRLVPGSIIITPGGSIDSGVIESGQCDRCMDDFFSDADVRRNSRCLNTVSEKFTDLIGQVFRMHQRQIEAGAVTSGRLGLGQRGLGGASCGPDTLERYRIAAGVYRLRLIVSRLW